MISVVNKWIVCPRPNPNARMRLFCFPYAGGGASLFRLWTQNIASDIEVNAVQLPGRENRLREPLFTQLSPLVQTLADALAPHFDRPFAFFGHSMGAIIGFELARQLRRQRNPNLLHLFVSARIAPQAKDPEPPIYQLSEPEFIAKLRQLNGTPEAVLQVPELRQTLIPILRADLEINEAYSYTTEDPLDIPISAFGGWQDPKASQDDLKKWADQTHRSFMLRMVTGDHFFISSAQSTLLQAISQDLQSFLS